MSTSMPNTRGDNPIERIVERQGVMILDGGLATALEAHGADLNDPLWSARLLIEDPDLIRRVHREFLDAGADCIATASYQASLPGFRARGLSEAEGIASLERSVALAVEVREDFWSDPSNRSGRVRPLVAASVGPYGAYLADGSEYTGDYGIGEDELYDFHEDRWRLLANTPADLLACETIPSLPEARVLLRLLAGTHHRWAWLSFSCRDGERIADGTRIAEAVRECEGVAGVAAVGINCTAPRHIAALITEVRKGSDVPLIVYPNSGELYDATTKRWLASDLGDELAAAAAAWMELGAVGLGGCCRVGAAQIAELRARVVTEVAEPQ